MNRRLILVAFGLMATALCAWVWWSLDTPTPRRVRVEYETAGPTEVTGLPAVPTPPVLIGGHEPEVPAIWEQDAPSPESGSVQGTVRDREGQPVSGIRIVATWPIENPFGEPLHVYNREMEKLYKALREGGQSEIRDLVHLRTARTDADGRYSINGLPKREARLVAITNEYWTRSENAWAVLPGQTVNWVAEKLFLLSVEVNATSDSLCPNAEVRATNNEYGGSSIIALGGSGRLRLPRGKYTVSAENRAFGLRSLPVDVEVPVSGRGPRLFLEVAPRLEAVVAFEGARLLTPVDLRIEPLDVKQFPGDQPRVERFPEAGVFAASMPTRDLPSGHYKLVLSCADQVLVTREVHYAGGRERVELSAPQPDRTDCFTVRSNLAAPGDLETVSAWLSIGSSGCEPRVWLQEDGSWLMQWPNWATRRANELVLRVRGWGSVRVKADCSPCSTVPAYFERTAMLSYEVKGVPRGMYVHCQLRSLDSDYAFNPELFPHPTELKAGRWTFEVLCESAPGRLLVQEEFQAKSGQVFELKLALPEFFQVRISRSDSIAATLSFSGEMSGKFECPDGWKRCDVFLRPGSYALETVTATGFVQKQFTVNGTMKIEATGE